MEVASVISLGIGANTENLPVGLAYGLRRLRIGILRNLVIAGITTAATLIPMGIGRDLRDYVPLGSPDVVAGLLLVGLGLLNMWFELRTYRRQVVAAERTARTAPYISFNETLALSGALSINNIGLGFAGGIAGLGYGLVAFSVAAFSVALLWMGEWASRGIEGLWGGVFRRRWLDGNLLIVAVGIVMMWGM
jgi:putative Mn2+ efflux pump MntP